MKSIPEHIPMIFIIYLRPGDLVLIAMVVFMLKICSKIIDCDLIIPTFLKLMISYISKIYISCLNVENAMQEIMGC